MTTRRADDNPALWVAVRALEERTELTRRTAERFRANGHATTGQRLARDSREAAEQAEFVRRVIESGAVGHEPLDTAHPCLSYLRSACPHRTGLVPW